MPAGVTAFQARHYYDYLDTALIISQSDSFAVTQRSPCKTLQVNWGIFQLEMVKIVLTSQFHKEVRATIGLVPTSQLP